MTESVIERCLFAPADFGNPAAEWSAACERVAVFDVSDRTQLEMRGPDRQSFLHNFCTNNIRALVPGQGCEAFLCNIKGRILGHVFAYADAESLWIDSVPGQAAFLMSHLERYHLLEEFTLADRSDDRVELLVTGPQAGERLAALKLAPPEHGRMKHVTRTIALNGVDIDVQTRHTDMLGRDSYLLSIPRSTHQAVWELLIGAGLERAGRRVLDGLRIEAGFPLMGVDISDENLAQEAARTEQCIVFNKGCYLGQEPIARLHAMGHVNKELKTVRLPAGSAVPQAGTAIVSPKDPAKELGRITSAGWSWTLNAPVALSMIRVPFTQPGSKILVQTEPPVEAVIAGDVR